MRWIGAAAAVLALMALVILRPNRPAGDEAASVDGNPGQGPASMISVERGKRSGTGSLPRFTPRTETPGERHSQALLLKQRARASGGRVPTSAELHDAETRDPVWAPAMEQTLSDRFHQDRKILAEAGLRSAKILAPQCRTSSCRFEIHYPEPELAQARQAGAFSAKDVPTGFLFQHTGPFARSWSDARHEPMEVVDGVTWFRQVVYVAFGEAESDPASYAAWVAQARREMEQQKRLGPQVPTRGVPQWVLDLK
jgi:hypothetical protein